MHVLAVEILIVFVARAITDFLADYLTTYLGMEIAMDMRGEFNDRLQRLPLSFFNWRSTGGLIAHALSDVQLASSIVTNTLFSLVGDSVTLLALVVGLFWMDWRFALIAFVGFPLSVLPVIGVARRVRKMYRGAKKGWPTSPGSCWRRRKDAEWSKRSGWRNTSAPAFALSSRVNFVCCGGCCGSARSPIR